MKKLISAVTSLAMAATMVSAIAPSVSAADASKGFSIEAYKQVVGNTTYAAMGNNVTISADDIAAGDVTVPCAVYLDEATNDTQALSVQFTINSDQSDVKNVVLKGYKPTDAYYAEAQSVTVNGVDLSIQQVVGWAGTVAKRGGYTAAGDCAMGNDPSQSVAGADNYFIGYSWTNNGSAYNWIGEKSTDYPLFVFDVTFPKGTANGTYTIDYCKYNTDATGKTNNPSNMIETDQRYTEELGNLTLSGMTFTIGDAAADETTTTTAVATTTTTTAEVPTTTTTTATPVGDADYVFDFGVWTKPEDGTEDRPIQPGDDVYVDVYVKTGGKACAGMDVIFDIDSALEATYDVLKSEAFGGAAVMVNPAINGANFKAVDADGSPIVADETKPVFQFTITVPEGTPDGTYNIGFGDKVELFKNSGNDLYTYEVINGKVIVGEPGEEETTTTTKADETTTTTTTATTAKATTTTTTAKATTTTTVPATTTAIATDPSGEKLAPTWGDSNVDGKVNVADVVVLNKQLANPDSKILSDQGKVNADVLDPQSTTEAVDPAGVKLTQGDSDAIIRSIVHLQTIPATSSK